MRKRRASVCASPHSTIRDGGYSRKGFGAGYSFVELIVGDSGRDVIGGLKGSEMKCTVSAALTAQDARKFTSISVITITLPRSLPISANGTFSFSGNVNLTPEETQTSMSFTEPIALIGHFTKVTVIADKTAALTGTFSSPAICEPATPRIYADEWDI